MSIEYEKAIPPIEEIPMRILSFAFILLTLTSVSCAVAQQPAGNEFSFEAVTEEFVSIVTAGWDSYSICEYIDRSDRFSYINLLIPASELSRQCVIMARHFVIRGQAESIGVDFSLYRIKCASDEAAMRTFEHISTKKTGTVADGKVLTRYAAQLDGNNIYVIHTQSFFDPAVVSFLESFAKKESKTAE
jgi:hypothetical protein